MATSEKDNDIPEGNELPANEPAEPEGKKPVKPTAKEGSEEDLPANEPAKLEMTPAELQAAIAKAIADNKEQEAEALQLAEAEAQGNFKKLYEDTQNELHKAELLAWRSKAIMKYSLSEKCIDYLTGNTEEEIMNSGKQLKALFDAERKTAIEHEEDDSLPFRDSHRRSHRTVERSGSQKTLQGMAQIFPLGLNLDRVRSTN